jgi:hypothetical protein
MSLTGPQIWMPCPVFGVDSSPKNKIRDTKPKMDAIPLMIATQPAERASRVLMS